MKALVYREPQEMIVADVDLPRIQEETDAIVRMVKTTICGTDLHILNGDTPEVEADTVLGHEGIGVVEKIGSAVSNFRVGDRVIISCVTACGHCTYCQEGMYAHCENGGWILGHEIDGTQSEFVRIPQADHSLYLIPEGMSDDAAVMMSDIFPTGFEIGVLNGRVKKGDTVAIIGAGPIGMATLLTAQFYSPAKVIMVDLDDYRLGIARDFGATDTINAGDMETAIEKIYQLTNGKGVDVAIEAAGFPATFDFCQNILAVGGHLANEGVHGRPVQFDLDKLWIKNVTVTTGLVSTNSTSRLIEAVEKQELFPERLVTHHFDFTEIKKAYQIFENASDSQAIKVILSF